MSTKDDRIVSIVRGSASGRWGHGPSSSGREAFRRPGEEHRCCPFGLGASRRAIEKEIEILVNTFVHGGSALTP